MASALPEARRTERSYVFADALLMASAAYAIVMALLIGAQLLAPYIGPLASYVGYDIEVEFALFDMLEPVLVFMVAGGVCAVLAAVLSWWLHGRPVGWQMLVGLLVGLAVSAGLVWMLVTLAERATPARGPTPLWVIFLVLIASVVHFSLAVWALVDAGRDVMKKPALHRRLDWLRFSSALLMLLLVAGVLTILIMNLGDEARAGYTFAIVAGFAAGFMVAAGDLVSDWLAKLFERNARVASHCDAASDGLCLTPELEARFAKITARLAKPRNNHHVISAIESMDGSFRWSAALGEADPDGRPVTIDTPYFIASIDKLYTATAILKLAEKGRLSLEESIATYLPESLVGGIHVMKGVDRSAEITVRHLLSHTSGLPDHIEDTPKGNHSLVTQLSKFGDRSWELTEAMRIVREGLTPYFEPQPLDAAKPKIRYSDTNFQLLMAIVETLHGKPIHEVFAEEIFEPLGMKHTWMFGVSEPLEKPAEEPATLWFGKKPMDIPQALVSLRSVYSTTADQIASLRGIITGSVFDDPATAELMQQQWNRFGVPTDMAALRSPGWPIEYGLGMKRFKLPGWSTPFGAVPEVVGHTGSTGTWLFYAPALDVFFAGAIDQATAGPAPFRYIPKLLDAMVKAGEREAHAEGGAPLTT